MSDKLKALKEHYEGSFRAFMQYINPLYCYGDIHFEVMDHMQYNGSLNELYLLPRDHLKSHIIAGWVVWTITRSPWETVVYLTAGEDLATNQMYAMKQMLTTDAYSLLWPEMVNPEEAKRDKWSADAINVDHPARKERGIRDNTIKIKTVKSNSTGLHCGILVYDDVVVPRFAYSATGRLEVQQSVAQFSSIASTDAIIKAVGTRYHPKDLYQDFIDARETIYDENGEIIGEEPLWTVFERKVEDRGNGGGTFLWPRTYSPQLKKWYGFDRKILSRKKAEYLALGQDTQFHAQYYNEANDPSSQKVQRDQFQYLEPRHLVQQRGCWYYRDRKLNLQIGMDVAWTDASASGGKRADFTAVAVVGIDFEGFIYVLALDRFKTSDYDVYYKSLKDFYIYWGCRKIHIETNSGGKLVKQEMEKLFRRDGYPVEISGSHTTKNEGAKEERHAMVLEPRYKSGIIYHTRGGYTPALEEEIMLARPAHDDLEDAVCMAIERLRPPKRRNNRERESSNIVQAESRFGGRRRVR